MLEKIKTKIERELNIYARRINKIYLIGKLSPLLLSAIQEFILRPGKRLRPILFVLGYLGYARQPAKGLFRAALSVELLHDFLLIHDDIIDKSNLRRGKPTMHTAFNNYLRRYKNIKFSGEDLAIVSGDIIYPMAVEALLGIQEKSIRKEKALKKLLEATIRTGSGEFLELLYGLKGIEQIKRKDIYRIYDAKTAYYSFAYPLAMGALLAGASAKEINLISPYGLCLGRAFQIKDDILGIFGKEKEIGKSILTDLREAKKTLLVWYAWRNADKKERQKIKNIFWLKNYNATHLLAMRKIILKTGALQYAQKEITRLEKEAADKLKACQIKPRYKKILKEYCHNLLQ